MIIVLVEQLKELFEMRHSTKTATYYSFLLYTVKLSGKTFVFGMQMTIHGKTSTVA